MSGQNVNVCDIGDDVKEVLKKFRFQKHTTNAALILKVCKDSSLPSTSTLFQFNTWINEFCFELQA